MDTQAVGSDAEAGGFTEKIGKAVPNQGSER